MSFSVLLKECKFLTWFRERFQCHRVTNIISVGDFCHMMVGLLLTNTSKLGKLLYSIESALKIARVSEYA